MESVLPGTGGSMNGGTAEEPLREQDRRVNCEASEPCKNVNFEWLTPFVSSSSGEGTNGNMGEGRHRPD